MESIRGEQNVVLCKITPPKSKTCYTTAVEKLFDVF